MRSMTSCCERNMSPSRIDTGKFEVNGIGCCGEKKMIVRDFAND